MRFLIVWFRRLINCIRRRSRREIPLEIQVDELLIRAIVHPMFYSNTKKKIKGEAFLPPADKNDVSVLRRHYTNDDFCKRHSASLNLTGQAYVGMATLLARHVYETEAVAKIGVGIKATPLDETGNYIQPPVAFVNQPGLPMHADILYASPMAKGEVYTQFRKFANELAKIANMFLDEFPQNPGWRGKPLTWEERTGQNRN